MTDQFTRGARRPAARRRRGATPLAALAVVSLAATLVALPPLGENARAATAAVQPPASTQPPAAAVPDAQAAIPVAAQDADDGAARVDVPWGVGERLTYDVRFGPVRVGSGSMEVLGTQTVRGREAYHTAFRVRGGTFFYKVNDLFESWIDTRTLASLRFVKDQQEGGRDVETRYEIFPERRTYDELTDPAGEQPSVANPLDDGSFLYFVRTVPLRIGETYEFNRYFKPERNPVRIRVLRRERVKVPAGTFDAVVVQPSIKTRGIFSEGGRAEVWLSDDDQKVMLQMKSSLSFGTLHLQLKTRQAGEKLAP